MENEKLYTIAISSLPEGWKPVAYRKPIFGEYYFYNDGIQQGRTGSGQFLIVEKCVGQVSTIQPRRIVLEKTGEETIYPTSGYMYGYINNDGFTRYKTMREVKEE